MALARKMYTISQKFPPDEVYGLTSQLRRCSVSIPANIAEGYGRYSPQDNRRFLRIANGSLYELQTLVELARDFGYIKDNDFGMIENDCDEIGRILSGYIKKLSTKIH
jgi:four helix bundle protein